MRVEVALEAVRRRRRCRSRTDLSYAASRHRQAFQRRDSSISQFHSLRGMNTTLLHNFHYGNALRVA